MASQVPEKHVMPVNGCCPVHDQMSPKEVSALKEIHPNAQVLAHPECNAQVLELADYIGSTTGILKFAAGSTSREFIICTENACAMNWNGRIRANTFIFLIQNQFAGI